MSVLIKKEIRLIFPGWVAAIVLAIAPMWLLSGWAVELEDVPLFDTVYLAGIMLMGLTSFGQEFNFRTFPLLLAQPISRRRIWFAKLITLGAAYISVLLTLFVSWELFAWHHHFSYSIYPVRFAEDAVVGLAILIGGLWTTLLLRQVAAAMWFTFLVPLFIIVLFPLFRIDGFGEYPSTAHTLRVLGWSLLLYSVAGFAFARWLLFRAQDVQWSGGNIVMPELRGLSGFRFGSGTRRRSGVRAALQAKEFKLHQSQLIIAGVLLLFHVAVLIIRKYVILRDISSLGFVLHNFWVLWLLIPLLLGCAAAAEERKLGTLESQLCLPARWRAQFIAKAGGVFLLSILLGVVMPLLLEGTRILPDVHLFRGGIHFDAYQMQNMTVPQIYLCYGLNAFNQFMPCLTQCGIVLATALISFYASTFSRNSLQALGYAVFGLLLTCFLVILANNLGPDFYCHPYIYLPGSGGLSDLIGVPALVIVLLILASSNCRCLTFGARQKLKNFLVILAVLGLVPVVSGAIVHRAWERLTPLEPAHGKARLAPSDSVTVASQWNRFSVRLPDGRVWSDTYDWESGSLFLGNLQLHSLLQGQFYEGSNWLVMTGSPVGEEVGIKTDGTLWVSETPASRRLTKGQWFIDKAGPLVRFGTESNWSSVYLINACALLVKNDGTLWRWGTTGWDYKHQKWPGFRAFVPKRVGTESDWVKIYDDQGLICARKKDGSIWTSSFFGERDAQVNDDLGFAIQRAPFLQPDKIRSTAGEFASPSGHIVAIFDDGTFHLVADQGAWPMIEKGVHSNPYPFSWKGVDIQLGNDTNWLAVAGLGKKMATLKNDGTIWVWDFPNWYPYNWDARDREREIQKTKPVQLGTHSDWVGIASAEGGIISLAADGSLWYWRQEGEAYVHQLREQASKYDGWFVIGPMMDVSRKPQLLGNVFATSN